MEGVLGDLPTMPPRRKGLRQPPAPVGPHYCVGAPLARIEVRAALTVLLATCPDLRLDPDATRGQAYS
jgi:cytochrome P450